MHSYSTNIRYEQDIEAIHKSINSALLLEQRGLDRVETKTLKSVIALYFQFYQQDDPDPVDEVEKEIEPRRSERRESHTNQSAVSTQSVTPSRTSTIHPSDLIPGKGQGQNKIKNGVSNGNRSEGLSRAVTGTGMTVGGGGGEGGGGKIKVKLNGTNKYSSNTSDNSEVPKRKKMKIIEIDYGPKGENARIGLHGEHQDKARGRGRPRLEQSNVQLSNKIDLTVCLKNESSTGTGTGAGTGKGAGGGRTSVGGMLDSRNALENAKAYAALRRDAVKVVKEKGKGTSNLNEIAVTRTDNHSQLASSSSSSSSFSSSSSSSHLYSVEGDEKLNLNKSKPDSSRQNARQKLKEEKLLKRMFLKKIKAEQLKNLPRNYFNLYWIKNSRLPCIYYDKLGGEERDRFNVLPICCTTYHYTVLVSTSSPSPYPIHLLYYCPFPSLSIPLPPPLLLPLPLTLAPPQS